MAFPFADETVEGCAELLYTHTPKCYAVPGNHDWYDSLTVFTSLFLRGRSADSLPSKKPTADGASSTVFARNAAKAKSAQNQVWLGGYALGQDQTYFALKLPKGWWVFGVDLGLYNDIDINQLRYFLGIAVSSVATETDEQPNVLILCHEPVWWYKGFRKYPMNINKLLKVCKQYNIPVRIWLAGDVHNYRRDSDVPGVKKEGGLHFAPTMEEEVTYESQFHKIIAGGGGAFLHPTWVGHDQNSGHNDSFHTYKMKNVYPSAAKCYRLAFLNIFFPFYNRSFGLLTAGLYSMLLWWVHTDFANESFLKAFLKFQTPMPTTIASLLALGCVYFPAGTALLKVVQGGLHFVAHMFGIHAVYALSHYFTDRVQDRALHAAINGTTYVLGGYLVGSTIMGLYLLVSALFGTHWNESYSSIKNEDSKSFVRMHITENGDLELYVLGIEKANKKWETAPGGPNDYKEPLIRPVKPYDHFLVDYVLLRREVIHSKPAKE